MKLVITKDEFRPDQQSICAINAEGHAIPIISFSEWDGLMCINRPTVSPDNAFSIGIKLNGFGRMATAQEL